jgi:hypothetical protein
MIGSMNDTISDFYKDIARVADYISRGYEIHARAVFNGMYDTYSKSIQPNTDLQNAIEIWVLLDEYLNAEFIGDDFSSKKDFLMSAFADFVEERKDRLGKQS